MKKIEWFSADILRKTCKIIFSEYGLPHVIVSDANTNFISEKFKNFCTRLGITHAVSSLYNYQNKEQGETCIKFMKRTMKILRN